MEADLENVTVEVKDSKGAVREVEAQDLAKGATSAQFDFVKAVDEDDLVGVWTVNGVEYNFDELELVADIVTEASAATVNEVKLYNLLIEAGIKNVDTDYINATAPTVSYAGEIASEVPVTFAELQKVIDDVNEARADAADDAAAVKAVLDANNQIQLLAALKENFERVNADWIADYASGAASSAAGFDIKAAGTDNEVFVDNSSAAKASPDVDDIQAAIDAVNDNVIGAEDTAAGTFAEQAAVTALIEKWVKNDDPDTPTITPKADAIAASKAKEAAFKVAEAKTENTLYNALVAYANATPDTALKASELNVNLKSAYKAELDVAGVQTTLVATISTGAGHDDSSAGVKAVIVTAADATVLAAAEADIAALTAASKPADIKKALQKLADVTLHKTGAAKFDMATVNDELLVDYATEIATKSSATLAAFVTDIKTVNEAAEVAGALGIVNDEEATAAEVRNALIDIVIAEQPLGGGATTDVDFLNLSAQAKLEVAEFVIEARPATGYANNAAIIVKADGTGALATAMTTHTTELGKFNAIGDLSTATTTTIKTALDNYAYEAYEALSNADKVLVATEIKGLTKDVAGTVTPLDFTTSSGADEVTTLKAANDIIDAAIAAQ